jgi:CelD/BcsL family acetyltransferase involved in cellulose biosynthesis
MTTPVETVEVVSRRQLEALEPSWWGLWERSEAATPFQSPAWLIPWWAAFEPGPLMAIAAWRGDRLVGLWPGYLEVESGRLLPLGISASDHLDVLLDAADPEAGAALLRHAASEDWVAWCLEELRPGAAALGLAFPDTWRITRETQSPCPVLDLAGTGPWPDAVPKRRRDQVRHALNAAARQGRVTIEKASAAGPFLDALERLHGLRWALREEKGVLADPCTIAFHREAARRLEEAGLLRAFVLAIGDEIVACHYGFAAKSEAFYYIGGFEPCFARQSPGTILIGHAIEDARTEGCRSFSFLRGGEPYKYAWGAVDRWNQKLVARRI